MNNGNTYRLFKLCEWINGIYVDDDKSGTEDRAIDFIKCHQVG